MKPVGKPDAGNPHVRFDERGRETGQFSVQLNSEAKVASEPEVLITWFGRLEVPMTRIGLEAGPLSQWLLAGMRQAGLTVELLETRHVSDAFKAMLVYTDRNDARGIVQLMRLDGSGRFTANRCQLRSFEQF